MKIKETVKRYTQTHWLFASLAFIFGMTFVLIVPPMWGLDEPSHFIRVYQIAHINKLVENNFNVKSNNFKEVPINLVALSDYAIGDLVDNKPTEIFSRKDVDNNNAYKKFTDAKFSKKEVLSKSFSTYSPLAYVGPVIGTIFADLINANIGQTLFLARLFSLLTYILLGWLSIRLLRSYKLRWLFFIILLLPTALFQGSVISADGILIGLSLLFTSIFIRLLKPGQNEKNTRLFYVLCIIAIVLPLIKFNYIFLSLLILLIPNTKYIKKKIFIILKSATIIIAAVLGAFWQMFVFMMGVISSSQRPDGLPISVSNQIIQVIHNPFNFVVVCFRSLIEYGDLYIHTGTTQIGWNYVDIPLAILLAISCVTLIAAIYAKNEIVPHRRKLLFATGMSMIGAISIFAVLYAIFNPVGWQFIDGVQGRYFIPFLIPILITIASFVPFEIKMNKNVEKYVFVSIVAIGLIFSVIFYYLATY